MRIHPTVLATALVIAAACAGDDPSVPGDPETLPHAGAMAERVEGWAAASAAARSEQRLERAARAAGLVAIFEVALP